MSLADRIRSFAYQYYVRPALTADGAQFTIRAGDVHARMGLQNRMPAVCGALGSKIFQNQFGLELLRHTGPPQGANTAFNFQAKHPGTLSAKPPAIETRQPTSKAGQRGDQKPKHVAETVYLVSCVSKKRAGRVAARDLYLSDWFIKARGYVEASGCPWFILSAEYGFVDPGELVDSYEKTLNTMPVSDRRLWAERVIRQISEAIPQAKVIVFLAGQRYREFLEHHLRNQGVSVEVPMEGLRIGEQLAWLSAQTKDG